MLTRMTIVTGAAILLVWAGANADAFGTGENQFTLDFVPISAATNPTSGIPDPAEGGYIFNGVPYDYCMGTFDITNDQWNKFTASLGMPVTGSAPEELTASWGSYMFKRTLHPGVNLPVTGVNWYMAAQFVNWLNTSTGHPAAYNFTGTQGTADYAFSTWPADQAAGGTNLYRNKDAFYFLPSEDEWVKAAYWNGTSLQTYATKDGSVPAQGDGVSGTGWNYYDNGIKYATNPPGPWAVGSGSQELNGTYDMMGNVFQWMESPAQSGDYIDPKYGTGAYRAMRGGDYGSPLWGLESDGSRGAPIPMHEYSFRVASQVPEPATLSLLALGGLVMLRLKR